MVKILLGTLFFINLCYAQVNPAVSKEKKTGDKYNRLFLLDTIHYKPQFSVSVKPVSNDKDNFPLGGRHGKIYRDNFTGRIYFQNGFDRTLIYLGRPPGQ